ncbi:hypothetical protein R3P38DRAFT_3068530 [Favolaschia claudopus]|uniref:Uncharacterized protein n=1 Tax=Favolaschia claudopus TaxID=2862362 RepID=A0AAW0A0F3_9AGAR
MSHSRASSRSDSPSSVTKEASLTQSSAIPVDGAWTGTILHTSTTATRPDHQRNTAAPSNKHGFMSKFVASRDNTPQTPSKDDQGLRFSRLSKRSKNLMRQLLSVDGKSSQQVSMKWEHFTKLMREMGFDYDSNSLGSSVRFDPPNPADSPITLHKPHPDPTLHPNILREYAKKLKKIYGWDAADFLAATQ